jgi:hypothetical protein
MEDIRSLVAGLFQKLPAAAFLNVLSVFDTATRQFDEHLLRADAELVEHHNAFEIVREGDDGDAVPLFQHVPAADGTIRSPIGVAANPYEAVVGCFTS